MGKRGAILRERAAVGIGYASVIEICERSELTLSGCEALLDFSSESVFARTKRGEVRVFGRGLCVSVLRSDLLVVRGRLERLELFGEGGL